MLGRLNHVALAVPDLAAATAAYRDTLGARVTAPQALPEHGVTVVFVDVGNTKIELLEPLGEGSPIAAFLEKNPSGGMHHVCYEVDDILAARDQLEGRRRACAGRRQSEDRRPRQAGAVPAPQGFLRDAGRTGAIMSWVSFTALFFATWWVVLFAVLPFSVQDAGRRSRRDAGHGSERAARAAYAARRDPHHHRHDGPDGHFLWPDARVGATAWTGPAHHPGSIARTGVFGRVGLRVNVPKRRMLGRKAAVQAERRKLHVVWQSVELTR